jgi:negative regulator of sigma E activity
MNDDDESVRAEAASAYLDGEIDADERASVSADPETMALVDTFARLRDTLGVVEPVPDSVRTEAVSAALAEFDSMHRVGAAPAPVIDLKSRWHRAYPLLRGAAAAVVIGVVAVAALNASKGTDSKSSSSATELPAAAEQPRTEAAPAPVAAGTAAPGATTAAAVADTSTQKMAAVVPEVNNAEDLARYASNGGAYTAPSDAAGAAPAATELVPAPAVTPQTCLTASDSFLGTISVLGSPAYAMRNNSTGIVTAVDANDCHVLLTAASQP